LIKTWARKELQNLRRLNKAKIPSPTPHILRDHILIMEFIGNEGVPAPCLKDCELSPEQTLDTYIQVVRIMRKMYQECKIVHADLSEYNLLYFDKKIYVIDVSQAIENDHQNAMDFLRRDCSNITSFFTSKGVPNVMSVKQLFEFVTDVSIASETEYLRKISIENASKGVQTPEEKVDENVFLNSFMPRTLSQVKNPEKDIYDDQESGQQPIYSSVTGIQFAGTEKDQKLEKNEKDESEKEEKSVTIDQSKQITQSPNKFTLTVEILEDEGLTSGGEDNDFCEVDEDEDDLDDFVIVDN